MNWLMRVVRRRQMDRDLDRELGFHVDEEAARLRSEGVPDAEARRRALASFGGLDPMKEYARDARGTRWIQDVGQDLRYAGRVMRRHTAFTTAAVLSLGLAIGANAAIFGVTDALLLKPLPVERPSDLVFLNRAGFENPFLLFSHPLYERLKAATPNGTAAAMTYAGRVQLTVDGPAELATGQLVTGNWFDVLGVKPSAGRLLSPADEAAGSRAPAVVLSHRLWTTRFGANASTIGSRLRINGLPVAVVGVTSPDFDGVVVGERTDLWLPASLQDDLTWRGNASTDDVFDPAKPWTPQEGVAWLNVVVRVPPSVRAVAETRLAATFKQDVERRLATVSDEEQKAYARRAHLELMPGVRGLSGLRESFSMPLYVLMATAAIVLLIGCANLASLLLARGTSRSREFALRLSLGAKRGRLVRQMLTESVALAALGGVAAVGIAVWGSAALLRLASASGRGIPLNVELDWRLLAFTAGVSVLTGLAFGLTPALRLSRAELADAMKPGGRVTGDVRRAGVVPFGRILVAGQVALSLTLLIGAVLFLRTFGNLLSVQAGFDHSRIVSARFDPRLARIPAEKMPALHDRLLHEARQIPGAELVSLGMAGAATGSQRSSSFVAAGQPQRRGQDGVAREEFVGPDYFRLMGMPIVRGRDFAPEDAARRPGVVIINETMARAYFGEADPIAKRIGYDEPAELEIVGVVRDALVDGLRTAPPRLVFHDLRAYPEEPARNLYVRVRGSSDSVKTALAQAVARAEPGLAIREVVTLEELMTRTVSNERLMSRLTGAFSLLAVLVSCVGLYGTISYSVARRTGEIGVRIALGASPGQVMRQVLGETAWLVGLGAVAGVGVSIVALRYTETLLYGLSPRDPLTIAVSALALALVGVLAGVIPARRAAKVDPLTALRIE
jgi:predicted permease